MTTTATATQLPPSIGRELHFLKSRIALLTVEEDDRSRSQDDRKEHQVRLLRHRATTAKMESLPRPEVKIGSPLQIARPRSTTAPGLKYRRYQVVHGRLTGGLILRDEADTTQRQRHPQGKMTTFVARPLMLSAPVPSSSSSPRRDRVSLDGGNSATTAMPVTMGLARMECVLEKRVEIQRRSWFGSVLPVGGRVEWKMTGALGLPLGQTLADLAVH